MVLDRMREMLTDRFGLSADGITEKSNFSELGLDSLDLMEMVTDLEEEFDVVIDTEDPSIDSIGALAEMIETLRKS